MTILISSDEIKKSLPDYDPSHTEKYQTQSTKLADSAFYKHLRESTSNEVIIMGGGAASGKTEFLTSHLVDDTIDTIIFDTTLSSIVGARIKIKEILKKKKTPVIYFVIPDTIYRAYIAFLHRDRKFADTHFYRTHSESRKTLQWIKDNFPSIKINIIESSYTKKQKMQFAKIEFTNDKELREYIRQAQISETDILRLVTRV